MDADEYQRSLKMPEAEEIADLLFYRPLAFVFVKLVYRTRLTPNQVTLLSMIAGCSAGFSFAFGTMLGWVLGGCLYFIANVLDCADGQLARLQNSGTLLGRVVDGVADYVSSIAVFLGIGVGLMRSDENVWWLVALAAVSTAAHALFFDHYQSEYIAAVRSETNFRAREIVQFAGEVIRMRAERRDRAKIVLLSLYLRYLRLQQRIGTRDEHRLFDPSSHEKIRVRMIRLWSFLGPTTNRTLLIVCAFLGRVDLYQWLIVAAGNVCLAVVYLLQRYVDCRMVSKQMVYYP